MTLTCPHCATEMQFSQTYPFHAGFCDQGFLYNDAGNCTLVWSSFDPAYSKLVGGKHPWTLDQNEQATVEAALKLAPFGGRWRFANPLRCTKCGNPVSGGLFESIYFYVCPNSVLADGGSSKMTFGDLITGPA